MARPKNSLSPDLLVQAEEDYKTLKDGALATRLKAIIAYAEHSAEEIAAIFKVSPRSIFRWVHTYRAQGLEGLRDQPKGHYPSKFTAQQKATILSWVTSGKAATGNAVHWTVKRLQHEIQEVYGITISQPGLWKNLRKWNLVIKKPRPVHDKTDPATQTAFKKNSPRDSTPHNRDEDGGAVF